MKDAWQHIDKGDLCRTKGMYDKAIAEYDTAIEVDPALPVPHFYKHAVYLDLAKGVTDSDVVSKYTKLAQLSMSKYHELLEAKRAKSA